jgi:hypothetical protein
MSLHLHPDKGGSTDGYQALVRGLECYRIWFAYKASQFANTLPTLLEEMDWIRGNKEELVSLTRSNMTIWVKMGRFKHVDVVAFTWMVDALVIWYQAWIDAYQSPTFDVSSGVSIQQAKAMTARVLEHMYPSAYSPIPNITSIAIALRYIDPHAYLPHGYMERLPPPLLLQQAQAQPQTQPQAQPQTQPQAPPQAQSQAQSRITEYLGCLYNLFKKVGHDGHTLEFSLYDAIFQGFLLEDITTAKENAQRYIVVVRRKDYYHRNKVTKKAKKDRQDYRPYLPFMQVCMELMREPKLCVFHRMFMELMSHMLVPSHMLVLALTSRSKQLESADDVIMRCILGIR